MVHKKKNQRQHSIDTSGLKNKQVNYNDEDDDGDDDKKYTSASSDITPEVLLIGGVNMYLVSSRELRWATANIPHSTRDLLSLLFTAPMSISNTTQERGLK